MREREVHIRLVGVPAQRGTARDRWQRTMARQLLTYSGPRWRFSTTPVHVHVEFRFLRPAAHVGTRGLRAEGRRFPAPTSRTYGDGDRLLLIVWEALVPKVLADRKLVSSWSCVKRWCREGEEPGCTVTVRDAEM